MTNILVTGANGQLGQSLKKVFATDQNLHVSYIDIEDLDLTDIEAVTEYFNKNQFDIIINCAAYTAVDLAEKDQVVCAHINTDAVRNIAEASRKNQSKIIHISTDYVFNGKNFRPYAENDVPDPQSVYGRTKLEGEGVLMAYGPQSIIIRTSWLYSEFGNNFMKTMCRLGDEKEEINVVCDQIGTPTYAYDLAVAIHSIINYSEWQPGIFHFSNEGVASWYDFAVAVMRIAGKKCKVNPITTKEYPTAATRPPFSVLNKSKIKTAYSLTIPNWDESLCKCINNYINH